MFGFEIHGKELHLCKAVVAVTNRTGETIAHANVFRIRARTLNILNRNVALLLVRRS